MVVREMWREEEDGLKWMRHSGPKLIDRTFQGSDVATAQCQDSCSAIERQLMRQGGIDKCHTCGNYHLGTLIYPIRICTSDG